MKCCREILATISRWNLPETPQGKLRTCSELYSSDRGFFSETNVKSCKQKGVRWCASRSVAGRKRRNAKAYEKSPAFKEGQRFRAGIEGRISVLFRGRGMKRCLAEGRRRFELLVGAPCLPTT